MMFEDMQKAEQYLRDANKKRMEGLDPDIVKILQGAAPHVVAQWLDEYSQQHKQQPAPSEPDAVELTDEERKLARQFRVSPEAWAKQKKELQDRKNGNG